MLKVRKDYLHKIHTKYLSTPYLHLPLIHIYLQSLCLMVCYLTESSNNILNRTKSLLYYRFDFIKSLLCLPI